MPFFVWTRKTVNEKYDICKPTSCSHIYTNSAVTPPESYYPLSTCIGVYILYDIFVAAAFKCRSGIANMSNIFIANNEHVNTVVKCLYTSLNDSEFVLKLN